MQDGAGSPLLLTVAREADDRQHLLHAERQYWEADSTCSRALVRGGGVVGQEWVERCVQLLVVSMKEALLGAHLRPACDAHVERGGAPVVVCQAGRRSRRGGVCLVVE